MLLTKRVNRARLLKSCDFAGRLFHTSIIRCEKILVQIDTVTVRVKFVSVIGIATRRWREKQDAKSRNQQRCDGWTKNGSSENDRAILMQGNAWTETENHLCWHETPRRRLFSLAITISRLGSDAASLGQNSHCYSHCTITEMSADATEWDPRNRSRAIQSLTPAPTASSTSIIVYSHYVTICHNTAM